MNAGVIRIRFDDREVLEGVNGMARRAKALHTVFRSLRPVLRDDLKEHASREASDVGAWPRRATSTMRSLQRRASHVTTKKTHRKTKKRAGFKTRTTKRITSTLGKLPNAINFSARQRSLLAVSPVKWANVHNEGGIVGRGSHIPARPFLFLSDAFLGRAEVELARFVFWGWEK